MLEKVKIIAQDVRAWIVGVIFGGVVTYAWSFFPNSDLDNLVPVNINIVASLRVRDIIAIVLGVLVIFLTGLYIAIHLSRRTTIYKKRENIMIKNSKLMEIAIQNRREIVRSTRVTHWRISDNSVGRLRFRENLSSLAANGNTIRRLWQVQNLEDLSRLNTYVNQYDQFDNYNVKAIFASQVVIPEILVIGERVASISLPNLSNPRKIETAVHFTSDAYVSSIQEYFDVLWELAYPIKTGGDISFSNVERLRARLRSQGAEEGS